jgi:hypothetical protein
MNPEEVKESFDFCKSSDVVRALYRSVEVDEAAKVVAAASGFHPADILMSEDTYHEALKKIYAPESSQEFKYGTESSNQLYAAQQTLDPYFKEERRKKPHTLITLVYADKRMVCQFPHDKIKAQFPMRVALPLCNTHAFFFVPARIYNDLLVRISNGERVFYFSPKKHPVLQNGISWELERGE